MDEINIDRGDLLFLRAEVRRYFEQVQQALPAAVTNPIYFGNELSNFD